jgi:hypothetical protein
MGYEKKLYDLLQRSFTTAKYIKLRRKEVSD